VFSKPQKDHELITDCDKFPNQARPQRLCFYRAGCGGVYPVKHSRGIERFTPLNLREEPFNRGDRLYGQRKKEGLRKNQKSVIKKPGYGKNS